MRMSYANGELVPKAGVYKVSHRTHRLAAEVVLLQGQRFPRCSQCSDEVTFTLLPDREPPPEWMIAIHSLPVL
jgi:hypothetical protein